MILSGDQLAFPQGLGREWLCTNGRGGYAMGTVSGVPTRAYHGWLVAAEDPPRRRRLRLALVEAELEMAGVGRVALSSSLYPGAIHPDGVFRLLSFTAYPHPCWRYQVPGGVAEVGLDLVQGRQAARIRYRLDGDG